MGIILRQTSVNIHSTNKITAEGAWIFCYLIFSK